MPCNKRERTFISRTVLVSGQTSAIREHDFYEIGLLPRGGITNDVLIKCSNRDYHTDWADVSTLIGLIADTDWVETPTEVYNDTKPIGIGTPTPFPFNALTILVNYQQDLNLGAGQNTFLYSGTGIPLNFYGFADTYTAGGVEDALGTGEYAWFGAANQVLGDHTFNATTKTLTGIGGFDESSVYLDKTKLLFTHINTPPGVTDTNSIQIERGNVTISSSSVVPLAGKFYVFDKIGGMELQDETATKIYRLPPVDGANLEVLTSDGGGNLYWRANAFTGDTVITADNGLNIPPVPGTNVRLGGPLLVNTSITVDAASSLTIISTVTPQTYIFIDDSTVDLAGGNASRIVLSSILQIKTPDVTAGVLTLQDTSTDGVGLGDALTLVDKATGETEWKRRKYVQSFVIGDWSGGATILILESTHGMGLAPVIQVVNDASGYVAIPGNSVIGAGLALVLDEIKIDVTGDITLRHGINGAFDGRIMIM